MTDQPARETPADAARRIKAEVSAKHGLTVAELISPSKVRRIAHPRQEAMFRLRHEVPQGRESLPWIARQLRRLDHTTVLYGIAAYEARQAYAARAAGGNAPA